MKKIVISLLFVGAVAFTAYSQEEINTNQDTQDIPKIYFENKK